MKQCLQTKPVVRYHVFCRSNLENIISQGYSAGFRRPGPPPVRSTPPTSEYPPSQSSTFQDYGKKRLKNLKTSLSNSIQKEGK